MRTDSWGRVSRSSAWTVSGASGHMGPTVSQPTAHSRPPRHAELPRDRTLERGTLDLPAGHPGSERGEGGRTVSEEEGSGSKGNLGRRSSLAGPLGRSAVLPSLAGAPSSPHTARHRFR